MLISGLRIVREDRGYSVRQLADRSGISRRSIYRFEDGSRNAHPHTVRLLALILCCDEAELTGETNLYTV